MQLINVACGGTLVQHLPERFGHDEHRRVVGSFDGADHDVMLQRGLARGARRRRARALDQVPPPPGRRPARRGAARQRHLHARRAARGDRVMPDRVASCSACSGTPRPTSRARSSARSSTPRRPPASPSRRWARRARVAREIGAAGGTPRRLRGAERLIYSPPCAAVQGDQSNRLGDGRGGGRRAARAQAGERAAAGRADRRLRGAARAVRRGAPLARARRRRVRAADVGVPGRVQVAARRSRRAARARARRLPDRRRPRARPGRAADACACSGRSRRGRPATPDWSTLDRVLVWAHWSWFLVPARLAAVHPAAPSRRASRAPPC